MEEPFEMAADNAYINSDVNTIASQGLYHSVWFQVTLHQGTLNCDLFIIKQ
jgi:hypothetical protein